MLSGYRSCVACGSLCDEAVPRLSNATRFEAHLECALLHVASRWILINMGLHTALQMWLIVVHVGYWNMLILFGWETRNCSVCNAEKNDGHIC